MTGSGASLIPHTIEQLTLLTRLRLSFCRVGAEGLDLSQLRGLRVLEVSKSAGLDLNNALVPGSLPNLRELKLSTRGTLTQRALRPGLRKLTVHDATGPLPLTPEMAPTLDLADLVLQGYRHLPETLGLLGGLTRLCVLGSFLERLPASLSGLLNLEHLVVWRCLVTSMPPLGSLTKLNCIDISENRLTALPEGVINLPFLEAIKINHNDMQTHRWADLRMLPLCDSGTKGTRYASYDPSNAQLMRAIEMERHETAFQPVVEV